MSKGEVKQKLRINIDNFDNFINYLSIVSSIDDTLKIKIDNNEILIYSMISSGNNILAFKSFILKTSDYFLDNIDYKMDIIIPNCKKFVKNLAFLKDLDKVVFELNCKEDDDVLITRSFKISSGRFKVTWLGGDSSTIRDITSNNLSRLLDIENRKWSFNVVNGDFIDIKKLSSINGERIINMDVTNGLVIFSEKAAWELEVDKVEDNRNSNLIFNKRFLNCINDKMDSIEFNIFENFLLIKDDESNLLLSFEQSFEDD